MLGTPVLGAVTSLERLIYGTRHGRCARCRWK